MIGAAFLFVVLVDIAEERDQKRAKQQHQRECLEDAHWLWNLPEDYSMFPWASPHKGKDSHRP